MTKSRVQCLAGKGPHAGSLYIPSLRGKLLPGSAIAGYCGQYTTAPYLSCIEDDLAIGSKAGGFVESRISKNCTWRVAISCIATLNRSSIAVDKGEAFAIRAVMGADVIAALKREALG